MQPHTFRKMRAELASMWSPNNRAKGLRRLSIKAGYNLERHDSDAVSNYDWPTSSYEGENMQVMDISCQLINDFGQVVDSLWQKFFFNSWSFSVIEQQVMFINCLRKIEPNLKGNIKSRLQSSLPYFHSYLQDIILIKQVLLPTRLKFSRLNFFLQVFLYLVHAYRLLIYQSLWNLLTVWVLIRVIDLDVSFLLKTIYLLW